MDNLTHALVGAALAKAGLERHTPLATTTLIVAANAPDVDMLAFAQGPYFALAFRRGVTHGVPALLVFPFLVAGAVLAWDRWVRRRHTPDAPPARPRALLALAFIGLATHPALDWLNDYGMRWWLPFDGRWSYGDAFFILDPWLWLALGSAVYLGSSWTRGSQVAWGALAIMASALVAVAPVPPAAEVIWFVALVLVANAQARGLPGSTQGRRRLAAALCIGAFVYACEMILSNQLAQRDVLAAAAATRLPVEAVMVAPMPADPLGGEVVIRTPDGYVRGAHHWLGTPRTRLDRTLVPFRNAPPDVSTPELERVLAEATRDRDVGHYLAWSRFPYYRVTRESQGFRVRISDVRYDTRAAGSLGGVEVSVGEPSGAP